MAAAASGGWCEMTAATPDLRMPAFSPAIWAMVSPSLSAWSSETGVMTRERRLGDDVGGVEAASETDLEDQGVGGMLGEGEEGRRRGDLEESDGIAGVDALDALQQRDKLGLADGFRAAICAGELDALMEAHEMGRGVDVDALARRLQHGFQERGGGALAVGAGDMDDGGQAGFGVAELGEQRLDAAERQVDQLGMQLPQLGQEIVARAHAAPVAYRGGRTNGPRRCCQAIQGLDRWRGDEVLGGPTGLTH